MRMAADIVSADRSSLGVLYGCSAISSSLKLESSFNLFVPLDASPSKRVPLIVFLTGLTGDQHRAIRQTPILQAACRENVAIVFPDTSPRKAKLEGESDDYRVGLSTRRFRVRLHATCDADKQVQAGMLMQRPLSGGSTTACTTSSCLSCWNGLDSLHSTL